MQKEVLHKNVELRQERAFLGHSIEYKAKQKLKDFPAQ